MTDHPILSDDAARRAAFPILAHQDFFGHAGVAPLPRVAIDAIRRFADDAGHEMQETAWANEQVKLARRCAAQLIGGDQREIALLGPTSLGLNLVAHGLDWQTGDEVIYYADDYPANVYCWMELANRGVRPVPIQTDEHLDGELGAITWRRFEPLLTDRTRLVSLATCNFVSGYRIDYAEIGRRLHERGILFCLDAIQTLGAFAMDVEHVDFLAADSHKWLLGPNGAGIFHVSRDLHDRVRPTLLGSWNVASPNFIAQDQIAFESGGRRFEPGMLNHVGIAGMAASMRLLLDVGIDAISDRLVALHEHTVERARALGFERYLPKMPDDARTAIITLTHASADLKALNEALAEHDIVVSLRHDRAGQPLLRFSPHFYNTAEQIDRAFDMIGELL